MNPSRNQYIHHFKKLVSYNFLPNKTILPPKNLFVVLTYACNSRCIMCNIWKKKPKNELSENEWKKMLKDPIFQHIEKLNITGGEALLLPNFINILNLFITSMPNLIDIHIVTNGFATKLIVEKIKETLRICKKNTLSLGISVSLDAIGENHEKIRGIPSAFKKVEQTITALKAIQKKDGFKLTIGSLLIKQTLYNTEKLASWAKNNSLRHHFQIADYNDTYFDNKLTEKQTALKNDRAYTMNLYHAFSKKTYPHPSSYYWEDMHDMIAYHTKRSTPCPFLHDQFAIDALGNVYSCLFGIPIGNIRKKSLSSIYFNKKNALYKKLLEKTTCRTCVADCNATSATAYEWKKYLWFLLTRHPWHGISFLKKQIQHIFI